MAVNIIVGILALVCVLETIHSYQKAWQCHSVLERQSTDSQHMLATLHTALIMTRLATFGYFILAVIGTLFLLLWNFRG